jgi:photosystem II stability/assembly factor-like uncharacterized protein
MYRGIFARVAVIAALLFCRAAVAATGPDLHRVIFSDSTHGTILATSDTESIVLVTSDGGKRWKVAYKTPKFLRTQVWASRLHGWIGGNEGVLLETKDGGASWKPIPSGTERNINALYYYKTSLFIGANKGVLLMSKTPGANWVKLRVNSSTDVVTITHSGTRLFALSRAFLSFSDDGGQTWDVLPALRWDGIVDVAFFTPSEGVLSGRVVLLTSDAGKHVSLADLPFSGNAGRLLINGTNSMFLIYGSAESGSIAEPNPEKLKSSFFILSTDDRGRTWKPIWAIRGRTAQVGWLEDIASMGDGKLMAVGSAGLVSSSSDGGRTWAACYLRLSGSQFLCQAN